ncbi:sterol desaturase family protein [Streptomyces sp. URMC 123]|uniref:sterol desaturase family protein n=1 Tax=Streptomyces sp. URMC 123 TaxID=3423403 RepID=UPI003F1E23EA
MAPASRTSRGEALRASPPMFASPFLDRFSRVHPALPPVLYLPLAVCLTVLAARLTGPLPTAGWALLGYGLWTLTEYWVHRAVFHWVPRGRRGRRLHWMVHGVHHDHPDDPRRLVMPPLVSLPGAAAAGLLLTHLLGPGRGRAAMAGYVLGYLAYDMVHFRLHHHRPATALGRALRRRHLQHHFQDDRRGFGVSCPYWDHVFGTAPARARRRPSAPSGARAPGGPPGSR